MKFWEFAVPLVALVGIFTSLVWIIYTANNAITPISVSEVSPGIFCALATNSDAVAIDCWEASDD